MKNQDEIDTTPVVVKEDTRVTFESIEIEPGERAEILLAPERPLRCPFLFMSNSDRECRVIVEQVCHARSPIFVRDDQEVENFRFGRLTDVTVTSNEPIKVVIVNTGSRRTLVGASLVANPDQKIDTTYRLTGDDAKDCDPKE